MESNVSIPIKICEPRSFFVKPVINRFQATAKAGSRSEKIFRVKSFIRKGKNVNVKLVKRRLAPFWNVRCRSRFHYDRETNYDLHIVDGDAVEITIKTLNDQEIVVPVNRKTRSESIVIGGWERCITERDITEYIDTYSSESRSFSLKTKDMQKRDEQAQLSSYLSNLSIPIHDLPTLYQDHTIDGKVIFSDVEDEDIQVILPDEPANRIVSEVMKKVMVSIDPIRIHDWSLSVDTADLYYRPFYIFELEQVDNDGNILEIRYEQLDAIRGDWRTITSSEIERVGRVPWDKIMMLTIDASLVVLQELGGPWVRVASGLTQVGIDNVPGIVEDMQGTNDEDESSK